jgi:hypothetical protein
MNFQFHPPVQLQQIFIKILFSQVERAESLGHVENFEQLIRHLHPECNGSIRMAKELAMIQFTFTATCHQVNFVIFIYFLIEIKLKSANRIDINFTRQRICHRRGSLCRSWMLFTIYKLQRVHQTDEIVS